MQDFNAVKKHTLAIRRKYELHKLCHLCTKWLFLCILFAATIKSL